MVSLNSPVSRRRRVPWVSCSFVGAVLLAGGWPAVANGIEDLRSLSFSSSMEWWRPLTGHLAHRGWTHLLLNVVLFAPLALFREQRRGSVAFLKEYLFLAAIVAAGVRLFHGDWQSYRGLSGIIYGFLVLILVQETVKLERRIGRRRVPGWSILVLALLLGKTLVEVFSGGWAFLPGGLSDSLGVNYLPGSHLAGMVGGGLLALVEFSVDRKKVRPPAGGRDASQARDGLSSADAAV